jgi:hypothetical protein
MTQTGVIEYQTDWRDIIIRIRHKPDWSKAAGFRFDHLELESIAPPRAPLPITETGYRSHFTSPDVIAAEGGPVAFALAWLDAEARNPAWKKQVAARRQLSLF